MKTTCNDPVRPANWREPSRQTETDRPTRITADRYNLRANPTPTRYLDHLVRQNSSPKSLPGPVTLYVQATVTTGNRSRLTFWSIGLHQKLSKTQDNAVKSTSENISTNATTHQPAMKMISHASEYMHFPTTSCKQRRSVNSLRTKFKHTCKSTAVDTEDTAKTEKRVSFSLHL